MSSALSRFVRLLMMALVLGLATARPAAAQSEDSGPSILRDTETEALFADIAKPLVEAANLSNKSVKVILLNDDEINAFVAGSQNVYVNSGLLTRADNVNQVQFVIAHELGHVAGGHAIRMGEGMKQATGITLATMVLGAIAIAAGAGEAGMGLMMMGQRAALGQFLAFTRAQETSADLAGASYLHKAGISGKGGLDFFKKLQNQEYRLAIYATDSYDRTHPLSSERIAMLTDLFKKDPAWNAPTDPKLEARFQRVKAKLTGFLDPRQAVSKYPETDQSVPAHYARAYAYHLTAYPDKALSEADALLKADAHDPYFLELKGQILLESGRPADAIAPLREATEKTHNAPLIASMLGHALISTEDPKNYAEAKTILKAAVAVDNENPFAWYQLGMIYGQEGDESRAALATAERNNLEGDPKMALASAETAMRGIPVGTPDYLRAQDIAMVSRTALKKDKKGRDRE
ncbi:M48 family metalloprotease [Sphingomonas daechungensis]|uniref:M48 family metalloprotease n=1 Tax=Sphingomonas daechungensis TaxID=1176646 RepID=UPI0031E8354F